MDVRDLWREPLHRLLVPENELGHRSPGQPRSIHEARFFYLDTDVLFPETYETRDRLAEALGVKFDRYHNLSLAEQAEVHGDELWNRDPTPAAACARSSRCAARFLP